MDLKKKYALIRGLFEIAWADGEIQEEERNALQLLVSSLELDEANAREVKTWFAEAPDDAGDTWDVLAADPEAAELAMRQVLTIAAADRTFKWNELQLLDKVRERLGITDARFDELAMDVERSIGST